MMQKMTVPECRRRARSMIANSDWDKIVEVMASWDRDGRMEPADWDMVLYHLASEAPPEYAKRLHQLQEDSVRRDLGTFSGVGA